MDALFNARKIRYEILDRITYSYTVSKRIEKINLFINLDDMLHALHRPIIEAESTATDSSTVLRLASNMLNLAAHYRGWALRKNMDADIFMVFTSCISGSFRNEIYDMRYRDYYKSLFGQIGEKYPHINTEIPKALGIACSISKYIEHVYIIDSRSLEPSSIPYYISSMHPSNWNLYITRDPYDLQYAEFSDWAILYPDGDNSSMITSANLWKFVCAKENIAQQNDIVLDPALYRFSIALTGNRYRGIPRIRRCGWKSLYKIFTETIGGGERSPAQLYIEAFRKLKPNAVDTDEMNNALDMSSVEIQAKSFHEVDCANIDTQIVDIPDYENLITVSRCYFSKYPLSSFLIDKQNKPASIFKLT